MEHELDVSELIESVDIVEYISQFMELETRIDGEYWGVSCLTDHDTDPSFSVNPDKQIFYDFSSHKGGTVLDFIKYYNRCSFKTAVMILSDYVKDHGGGINTDAPRAHLSCAKEMKKFLPGIKREKEAKYKNLGDNYMDVFEKDWSKAADWIKEGISVEAMEHFGVRYDPIGNRLVFPIRLIDGTIINVSGRTLDPLYKEHGLRKYTYYFPLGKFDTIYGFYENASEILDKGEIILFEGAKSVMKAWGWGVRNAAALCTSRMNVYQFIILLKLGVRVVIALDSEVRPNEDENIIRLRKYLPVEFVLNRDNLLEEKMAPVDAGREVWEKLYEARVRFR